MATPTEQTTAIAVVSDINTLSTMLSSPRFKSMVAQVASKYMTEEKIVKIALLAVSRQPALFRCTGESVLQSIVKAAELGLDFAGQTGQGYLIPYANKNLPDGVKECQFIPGYQGLIELAYRSKQVTYIDSQLVHENDQCDYDLGSTPFIKHKPNFRGDRGKVLFGYVVVRLTSVDIPKIEIMSHSEIMKIKGRSMAGNYGPWKTDESEMMRKTVVRRAFKYIPKTPAILDAMEQDNRDYDLVGSNQIGDAIQHQVGTDGLKARLGRIGDTPPEDVTPESATAASEPTPIQQAAKEQVEKLKAADEARKATEPEQTDEQKKLAAEEEAAARAITEDQ